MGYPHLNTANSMISETKRSRCGIASSGSAGFGVIMAWSVQVALLVVLDARLREPHLGQPGPQIIVPSVAPEGVSVMAHADDAGAEVHATALKSG